MRVRVQEQKQEELELHLELAENQQQAPFRVLSPGGRILYEPRPVLRSPPPTRAPEPYKLTSQVAGTSRSQRKSSFAIIAEPQLAPLSRPSSGRLSPFRGRGFKGPPPRSSFSNGSRSPPENSNQRPRIIRPGSLSQNNSPKRSLIPRAELSCSASVNKGTSPRFGRRATHRYTSSVGNSDANHRRPSQRDFKRRTNLSLISSAAKNKISNKDMPDKIIQKNVGIQRSARSEERLNRKLLLPLKNVPDGKRFITAKTPTSRHKSSSTETLDSTSKIPLKQGSITGNSVGFLNKSSLTKSKPNIMKDTINKSVNQPEVTQVQSNKVDEMYNGESSKIVAINQNSIMNEVIQSTKDNDLGLIDLLKQSSSATGTSSVVNTTTTTAVQPLQIDASSILAESELVTKLTNLEKIQQNLEIENENPDSRKFSHLKKREEHEIKLDQNQQSTMTNNIRSQIMTTDLIKDEIKEDNKETNSKCSNISQTMVKHFGPNSNDEQKSSSNTLHKNNGLYQINETENVMNSALEIEKSKEKLNKRPMEVDEKYHQTPTLVSNQLQIDNKISIVKNMNNSSNSTSDSKKDSSSSMVNNVSYEINNSEEKTNNSNKVKVNNEASLKSQTEAISSDSLGSIHSTDTGVSVNTVRGISSAKEKTGLHLVKRSDEIETLSGNIVHIDKNGEEVISIGIVDGTKGVHIPTSTVTTRWQRLKNRCWSRFGCREQNGEVKDRFGRYCGCWSKMRCFACKRDPKIQLWPKKQTKGVSTMKLSSEQRNKPLSQWERLKNACRCAKVHEGRWCSWRRHRWQQHQDRQVGSADLERSCCSAKECLVDICRKFISCCKCNSKKSQRAKTIRAKHSLTSVAAPPLSEETRPKIPDVLVEHNSLMRGAIPCLPVPVAWFCLMWNVLLPGSGTIFSGFFNICLGQPRFSAIASLKARFGALIVNFVIGISQLFTVLFCLVGWGWSIWWGVIMIRLAKKYKRYKDSEAVVSDPEAKGGPDTATLPTPGVPTRGLRGIERIR
ncbi:PREDICTED: protein stum [Ceratosolen solmsi marchali]|uniref:Protein stum n=1 Tax=Ceratosolen solmsi marchali TaxID=326594 RepID=A0AAJ6VM51_9HYME|nr:PREDICTED: protein stum [Ceratosolen solmsi marchali]